MESERRNKSDFRRVMCALARQGESSRSDLGRVTNVRAKELTRILKLASHRGWLTGRSCSTGARGRLSQCFSLTEDGTSHVERQYGVVAFEQRGRPATGSHRQALESLAASSGPMSDEERDACRNAFVEALRHAGSMRELQLVKEAVSKVPGASWPAAIEALEYCLEWTILERTSSGKLQIAS